MNPKIFFGELKRRNVYKVAVAYGVVGWLLLYANRNYSDEMFKWLDTAYAGPDSDLTQLAITSLFIPYRGDPRFTALCQKLNVQLSSGPAKL
jgi:hypothetical protein